MIQPQGDCNHYQGPKESIRYDFIYFIRNVETVMVILVGDYALPDNRFDITVTMIGNDGLGIRIQGGLQVGCYAIYYLLQGCGQGGIFLFAQRNNLLIILQIL